MQQCLVCRRNGCTSKLTNEQRTGWKRGGRMYVTSSPCCTAARKKNFPQDECMKRDKVRFEPRRSRVSRYNVSATKQVRHGTKVLSRRDRNFAANYYKNGQRKRGFCSPRRPLPRRTQHRHHAEGPPAAPPRTPGPRTGGTPAPHEGSESRLIASAPGTLRPARDHTGHWLLLPFRQGSYPTRPSRHGPKLARSSLRSSEEAP